MSVITIGGGPHPNATIFRVSKMVYGAPANEPDTYEIRDGAQVLAVFEKLSHAQALLPLIQSGE